MSAQDRGELRVFETPQAVAAALADLFVESARSAIEMHGTFFVALAGGRTPRAAYELLAEKERSGSLDWGRVFVYFSDERCVPPESSDSNYKSAADAFLSRVPLPPVNIHRMHGEDDPARAARAYAQMVVSTMGDGPRFDLMLLGMGDDGHTASLFPGTDPYADEDELVRAPFVPQLNAHRLTMTPRVINNSRHVAITVEGEKKAATLRAVFTGPIEPERYPVQSVSPADGDLTWLADKAAAQLVR